MRVLIRLCACAAAAALLALATVTTASCQVTAQAGSAGGSLGKKGKSASGGDETPRQDARPKQRASAGAGVKAGSSKGCGNFSGTWTSGGGSWLYGANDTVFRADGSARHSSGIVGTWTCKDGVIDLIWKDWDHDQLKLSADGKRLDSVAGGRGFSR